MNLLFRLREFIVYQWKSKTKYYLHSPFVFQFYQAVLEGEFPEALKPLKNLREEISKSKEEISVQDFGTGPSEQKRISEIESKVAVREKYGLLLYRLVSYFKPENVLELGTSIGISSAYMSLAKTDAKIISLEGSATLLETAKRHHESLELRNTELIQGNFDDILPGVLNKIQTLDLVFFDGNHTRDASLRYFHQCLSWAHEQSVFIFDDIYYSPEMKAAWEAIKQQESVTLTIDVFQFGICLFRKDKLVKEHFVLRY